MIKSLRIACESIQQKFVDHAFNLHENHRMWVMRDCNASSTSESEETKIAWKKE